MEPKAPIEVRFKPAEFGLWENVFIEFIVKLELRQAGIPLDKGIIHRWRDLQTDEEVFLWRNE